MENELNIQRGRPSSPFMEGLIGKVMPVLDHGHVVVMDYMGTDSCIVQAARTSYQGGTKQVSEDRALLAYLMKHKHGSPYEMCELKIHVRLPIFVARQWIRHRTASLNEMSARYSILPDRWYCPAPEHLASQSKSNKQGRAEVLEGNEALDCLNTINTISEASYQHYERMLNEDKDGNILDPNRKGMARELARMILPVNFYTEWVWKCDLRNLLGFLLLRCDAHAQYEIRAYADVILDSIVREWLPNVHAAFTQHELQARKFSLDELQLLCEVVRAAEHGRSVDWKQLQADYKFSKRFMAEFRKKVGLDVE